MTPPGDSQLCFCGLFPQPLVVLAGCFHRRLAGDALPQLTSAELGPSQSSAIFGPRPRGTIDAKHKIYVKRILNICGQMIHDSAWSIYEYVNTRTHGTIHSLLLYNKLSHRTPISIILLFGQQTEPPHSLSRPRNFHINRIKIRETKITHHWHYDKNRPKIPLSLTKYSLPHYYKEINLIFNIVLRLQSTSIGYVGDS